MRRGNFETIKEEDERESSLEELPQSEDSEREKIKIQNNFINTIKDINKLKLDEDVINQQIDSDDGMILDKLKERVTNSSNNSETDTGVKEEKSSNKKRKRKISDAIKKGNPKTMFHSTSINRNSKLREELQFLNKVNRSNNNFKSKHEIKARKTTRNRINSFHLIRKAHTPVAGKLPFDGKETLQPKKLFRSSRKETLLAKRNTSKKKEI